MKTSYGKLAYLAFALLLAALFLAPMRAGREDVLSLKPGALKMSVGGSYRVICTLASDDPDQTLHYSVENPGVASIAPDGTVTAMAPGETIITARASGGAQAEMKVLVSGTPLTELTLNTDEIHMEKGQFSGLSVHYNADASDTRLQWVSGNEKVAKVDSAGRIEGVGGGVTDVSVISPSGKIATARVYVNVDATAAHISPNNLTIGVGAEVPLRVSYLPEDATDRVQRWYSSDENVLSISSDGILRAKGEGIAYVSVLTEDGVTDGMAVTVEAAPEDLQLDPAAATIERGENLDLQLKFLNEDGSVQADVDHLAVWSSDNEAVATVDQEGRVTAHSSGSCTISVQSDGITAKCKLNVQVTVKEVQLSYAEKYILKEDAAQPIQLGWILVPSDPDDGSVSFSSNNTQVANVNSNGLVTLTGAYGTANITAVSASGASAVFTVHVVTQLPEEDIVQKNLAVSVQQLPAETVIPVRVTEPLATVAPVITAEPTITAAPVQNAPAAVG